MHALLLAQMLWIHDTHIHMHMQPYILIYLKHCNGWALPNLLKANTLSPLIFRNYYLLKPNLQPGCHGPRLQPSLATIPNSYIISSVFLPYTSQVGTFSLLRQWRLSSSLVFLPRELQSPNSVSLPSCNFTYYLDPAGARDPQCPTLRHVNSCVIWETN